jgi:hypothetical protein
LNCAPQLFYGGFLVAKGFKKLKWEIGGVKRLPGKLGYRFFNLYCVHCHPRWGPILLLWRPKTRLGEIAGLPLVRAVNNDFHQNFAVATMVRDRLRQ